LGWTPITRSSRGRSSFLAVPYSPQRRRYSRHGPSDRASRGSTSRHAARSNAQRCRARTEGSAQKAVGLHRLPSSSATALLRRCRGRSSPSRPASARDLSGAARARRGGPRSHRHLSVRHPGPARRPAVLGLVPEAHPHIHRRLQSTRSASATKAAGLFPECPSRCAILLLWVIRSLGVQHDPIPVASPQRTFAIVFLCPIVTGTVLARPFSSAKMAHWSPFRNKALIGSEPATPVLLAGKTEVGPNLDEVDVEALITPTIPALHPPFAAEILQIDAPALVTRKIGGEIVLGDGRPSANRGDILSDLGGQPFDVVGIPGVVSGAAAGFGTDLERRTEQQETTQQGTPPRRSRHRSALQSYIRLPDLHSLFIVTTLTAIGYPPILSRCHTRSSINRSSWRG
jgi:hypothetical protein